MAAKRAAAALMSAAFVYIRKGSTVTPLSSLNKVLSWTKGVQAAGGRGEEVVSIDRLKPHRGLSLFSQHSRQQEAGPQLADPSHPHPQGLVLVGGHVAEKIDKLVMQKIPQIVRAESASFIVPVYSLGLGTKFSF
jgi:hypothetical protein